MAAVVAPVVTPLYAAVLTLMYVVLALRVIGLRRSARVSLGDAGRADLQARIRIHANFAEYVPLGLILLLLAELGGTGPLWLHLAGLLLLTGRLIHAWSLAGPGRFAARTAGMVLTFSALILAAVLALPWAQVF